MPLQVVCPACNAKLKAPDTAAGKKTKCPKCQAIVTVPVDAPQAPAATTSVKLAENWYMQTTDGSQFGPVPRSELNEWFQEGRLSSECQLLKEGSDQWQWASEIYPSLDQSAPAPTPSKPTTGLEFLGPATPANNDPLGLGNAALGAPMQAPAFTSYQAPAFPAATPSFGAGGGYGGSGYGVSTNPYSSPSSSSYGNYGSSYGGQSRSGLHPLVIVAAVIHFLFGTVFALQAISLACTMLLFLIGGASAIGALPPDARGGPELSAMLGMGLLFLLPVLLVAAGLSILEIWSGVALLKRRFWARIVMIVLSIIYLLPILFFFIMGLRVLDPCIIFGALIGIALHAVVLAAMFIPSCTSDFS